MASSELVPSYDELEDGHVCFGLPLEAPLVEELALFESGEEAFAHHIVVAVADRSYGRAHVGQSASRTKGDRSIPRTLIRMVDNVPWSTLSEGHLEVVEHELRA